MWQAIAGWPARRSCGRYSGPATRTCCSGATRLEIAREVLTEIVILATIGCATGALVANWAVNLIAGATPEEMQWSGFVQPQWSVRVLAMSAVAVLVSVAVAGGFPAWQASRTDPAGPLKEASGGNSGRAGTRFRWLVMAELALSGISSAIRDENADCFGQPLRI